ncbi:hypothetical protein DFH28DRAFT_927859 [Melampsora americana]|nr:hypothetical protein DFH28DRAFT_927859 [Melampsora americana]
MPSSESSLITDAPSPDIYALSALIKEQFDQYSRGDAILEYADGQIRYVHRYDCVTYHFADHNTPRARCIVSCIEEMSAELPHVRRKRRPHHSLFLQRDHKRSTCPVSRRYGGVDHV